MNNKINREVHMDVQMTPTKQTLY